MFKKNSWIVALILALAVTALFTGCIDALEPSTEVTYTEVELGEMNSWGGQPYQRGWSVAGLVFDAGGVDLVAADKGYKNEDFAKATKLVIEVTDGHPNGNLGVMWSGELEDGTPYPSGWEGKDPIASTKEGNVVTIDLTDLKNYDKYVESKIARRRLIIQTGGDANPATWVTKAKLLIPDIPLPPPPPTPPIYTGAGSYKVPVEGVGFNNTSFYVDLNNAGEEPGLNGGGVKGVKKIEADKLTAGFTATNENFFVQLSAEQGDYLTLAVQRGCTIEIAVVGTFTGATNFSYWLGSGGTENWNTFDAVDQTNANALNGTSIPLTQLGDGIAGRTESRAFIFRATSVPAGSVATLELKSIHFKVTGPGSAPTAISAITFTIDWGYTGITAPYAGARVPTKINAAATLPYTGTISWSPAPVKGEFAALTQYTAVVEVKAKLGNYFSNTPPTITPIPTGVNGVYTYVNSDSARVHYAWTVLTGLSTDPTGRPEYDGTGLNVTVVSEAGAPITLPVAGADVKTRNGNLNFKSSDAGFVFSSAGGGNYQEEYPYFKANVGARLANSRIRFKYQGLAGDIEWKTIGIAILDSAPPSPINDLDVNITTKGDVKKGTATYGKVIWNESYADNGIIGDDGKTDVRIKTFTATLTDAIAAGDRYYVITTHGGRKAFEIFDIEFLPTPPTVLNVKVGGVTQTIKPVGVNVSGSVELLDGSIGFKYKTVGHYDRTSYVYFPVDLGTDKKITDFSSVKFTITGTGDAGYKSVGMIVKSAAFTGEACTQANESVLAGGSDWGNPIFGYGNGTQSKEYAIIGTPVAGGGCLVEASAANAQNVFISIFVHHARDAVYTIKDIELVE